MNNEPVLTVRNLTTRFRTDRGVVTAVDDVSFDLFPGESLGVVGESGCGKTVTSKSIMRLLPEDVARRLLNAGVTPLHGLREALVAAEAASLPRPHPAAPLLLGDAAEDAETLSEAEAKTRLAAHGLTIPQSRRAASAAEAAEQAAAIGFPVVLKGEGIAHKTEAGAVALNLASAPEARAAAETMPAKTFLIEEQIEAPVAELLIGITRDPAHGFVLTLAAGGVLTELMQDSATLLLPATDEAIRTALQSLRIAPLLSGYRGKPAADHDSILAAIRALTDYATAHADGLEEVEINPLLCTPTRAVAADALIRRKD